MAEKGGNLNFKTKVDIAESKARLLELKALIKDVGGISMYRSADRAASLATQDALRKERLELIEISKLRDKNASQKQESFKTTPKRTTEFSNSQEEVDRYLKSKDGSINYTTALRAETAERTKATTETAKQAIANNELILSNRNVTQSSKELINSNQQVKLSKKELALLAERDKQLAAENVAAIKLQAKEMNAAKGSLDQRRAALSRLQNVFDGLNEAERKSTAGQRLQGIIGGLSTQVKDLEASTGRAQRNVGNYGSAFSNAASKAWSAVRQLAQILPGVGIAGLIGFAVEPIVNYISKLDLFNQKASATEGANRDIASAMGSAGSEAGKATLEVAGLTEKFKLAKDGVLSKKSVLDEYNSTIGKTIGFTNNFNDAEERTLKNGNAYIELMFRKATAEAQLGVYREKMAKAAQELAKTDDESVSFAISGTKGKGLKNIKGEDIFEANAKRNREAAAKPFLDSAEQVKKVWVKTMDDTAKYAKEHKLNFFESSSDPNGKVDSELNARNDLQKRIDELIRGAVIKSEDADKKELDSVKEKYVQMRAEVEKFYADQEKRSGKKYRVDISGLKKAEDAETADVKFRQTSKKQLEVLDIQRQQYIDYERFVSEYGQNAADERYNKQKVTYVDYLSSLKAEADKINLIPEADRTGAQVDFLKELNKKIQSEEVSHSDKIRDEFEKLLGQNKNYLEERRKLEEDYNKTSSELRSKGQTDAADQAAENYRNALNALDKNHAEQLKSVKFLFDNMDRLSNSGLKKALANARAEFDKLDVTPENKDFFNKLFGDVDKRIAGQSVGDFKTIASALGEAARSAGDLSQGLSAALGIAANLAGQVGNIKQGVADFSEAKGKGDGLGQVSSALGIFGSVLGVFSAIGSLFDHSQEIQRQREESLKREVSLIESVNKRIREQIELNKELLGDSRIKGYSETMADIAIRIDQQNKKLREQFQLTGDKFFDDRIQNNDPTMIGRDALKGLQDANSIAKLTEQQIKDLYDNGKLDDRAKAAYDSMIELRKQQKDLLVEMNQELTGVDFSGILDGFADIFQKEKPTIDDFAKYFEDTMRNAAQQAFKRNVLEESLKEWYNTFAELSKDGLTKAEKDNLQADYNKRVLEIQQKAKELEAFTGVALGMKSDSSKSTTAAGKVSAAITEDTASKVLGVMSGTQLATVQVRDLVAAQGKTMGDLYQNAISGLIQLNKIEANTRRSADTLDNHLPAMNASLQSISKSSNDNLGVALRAAGKLGY